MIASEVQSDRAREFAGTRFDAFDMDDAVAWVARRDVRSPFAYVVTPNVDHIVRLDRMPGESEALTAYHDADLSLCDSQVLRLLARVTGVTLPVVRGSDLTEQVIARALRPGARINFVGGDTAMADVLRRLMPGATLAHHAPPMGLLRDPAAMAAAVAFIEDNAADVTFLAVGSPQQELIAHRARGGGKAHGTALCVGAAIEFVTGLKARAPMWMRNAGLEWLHRLLTEPRRLWRRYLVEDLQIFPIVWRWVRTRKS